MPNRKLLLLIPVLLILACAIFAVLPPAHDGPTGAAQARQDHTPTCAVDTQAVVTDPQTITVNAGEKIQAAIDRARPGDTILIMPGTYNEGVVVKRNNITLRGQLDANNARPVLDGQKQIGNGVIACGDNFTIENLHVKNYQANGVLANGPDGVVMRNIFAEDTGEYGLFPVHAKNVLLENNVVTGSSDAALYVGQSENAVMKNNEAYGSVTGLEIENTSNAIAENNYLHDNAGGLLVFVLPDLARKETANNIVRNNRIIGNNHENFGEPGSIVADLPAGIGVVLLGPDTTEITGNEIRDNRSVGIALVSLHTFFSKRTTFDVGTEPEGNRIYGNTLVNNAFDPTPAAKTFGFPAVDIIWDGSGANNTFDQPGASSFPPMLPTSNWSPLISNAYGKVLAVLRRFF
jgi:cytochrome c peroxidase